jgi:hypothetical protein
MVRRGSRVQVPKVAPRIIMIIFDVLKQNLRETYPFRSDCLRDIGAITVSFGASLAYLGIEGSFEPVTVSGAVVGIGGLAILGWAYNDVRVRNEDIDDDIKQLSQIDRSD